MVETNGSRGGIGACIKVADGDDASSRCARSKKDVDVELAMPKNKIFALLLSSVLLVASCDFSKVKTYGEDRDAPPAVIVSGNPSDLFAPVVNALRPGLSDADMPQLTQKRIEDLTAIASALEAYKVDNGAYPSSGGSYTAYKMSWGRSRGRNWIPELIPKYFAALPRDPAESEDPDGPQYLYASDGTYFKLISHYPGDCETAIKSGRIRRDPTRTNPDGTCWAYGIWSPNGERY